MSDLNHAAAVEALRAEQRKFNEDMDQRIAAMTSLQESELDSVAASLGFVRYTTGDTSYGIPYVSEDGAIRLSMSCQLGGTLRVTASDSSGIKKADVCGATATEVAASIRRCIDELIQWNLEYEMASLKQIDETRRTIAALVALKERNEA